MNGVLLFEGEYLNDEKNGIGKEYFNGRVKCEANYLNGKKHGKFKEYDNNGNLVFEGEFENGEMKILNNLGFFLKK